MKRDGRGMIPFFSLLFSLLLFLSSFLTRLSFSPTKTTPIQSKTAVKTKSIHKNKGAYKAADESGAAEVRFSG